MDEGGLSPTVRESSGENPELSFIPLGGLGQIGMNCFALSQEGEILVVDCGATFPDDDVGEELIVPDFTYLLQHESELAGVFITHGHEDHIGALCHLVGRLTRTPPIYAPAHAAALIASRMQEQGLVEPDIRVVEPGQVYEVGSFLVEPIKVAHSIVQATALAIDTVVGTVVHTADFDLDEEQPAGWLTDESRFRELGERGVSLLLSDSTNIVSENRNRNEGDVGRYLGSIVRSANRRVVVAMFSSNAHRLSALAEAAASTGRRICILGRSIRRQFDLACALGHLKVRSDLLISAEEAQDHPAEQLLVLAGGSQGEPASALKKLSQGKHPHLQLEKGDLVVLSARVIPGNEKRVFSMENDLLRLEAQLITPATHPEVHVSGHASRSELEKMIEWVRPRAFLPVHGTLFHMKAHQTLALQCGVKSTCVVENGTQVAIDRAGQLTVKGTVTAGQQRLVRGGGILDARARRHRYSLARNGVLSISFRLDSKEQLVPPIRIQSRGVVGVDHDEDAINVIIACVQRTLLSARGRRMTNLEERVVQAVRSVVLEMCSTRPLVLVHVLPAEVPREQPD